MTAGVTVLDELYDNNVDAVALLVAEWLNENNASDGGGNTPKSAEVGPRVA